MYASDLEDDLTTKVDDECDEKMTGYKNGNGSDIAKEENIDDTSTIKYDRNSGGFQFFWTRRVIWIWGKGIDSILFVIS